MKIIQIALLSAKLKEFSTSHNISAKKFPSPPHSIQIPLKSNPNPIRRHIALFSQRTLIPLINLIRIISHIRNINSSNYSNDSNNSNPTPGGSFPLPRPGLKPEEPRLPCGCRGSV